MKNIPYIVIPNDELERQPDLKAGDKIICRHCGKLRIVKNGKREDGTTASLMYYKCGKDVYLAGIDGKEWA